MDSKYFWHCPDCNGNFDPGERCDCHHREEPGETLEVTETLIIGADFSKDGDSQCLQISRINGSRSEYVKTYYGDQAVKLYKLLSGTEDLI